MELSRKKLNEIVWCIETAINYHRYYECGKWKGEARLERLKQEIIEHLKATKPAEEE